MSEADSAEPQFQVEPGIADEICDWLAEGKTLRAFCAQQGKPHRRTIYKWIDADPAFAKRMETARRRGAGAIAEESLEIIDTAAELEETQFGKRRDKGHVDWLKNRAYHRMQLLAKWHPKEYGDRAVLAGDPDAPLTNGTPIVNVIIGGTKTPAG